MAIIPIDLTDAFARGKPENKLVMLWQLGMPVLAHLDKRRVMHRVEDPDLVKGRPAFHYRLPNCMVDEPDWTLAREWNTWVEVERRAADADRLAAMSRDFLGKNP